jgi:hypothetical protein
VYFENEIFDIVEDETSAFAAKGDVMLIGYFNARTGKLKDYVSNEGSQLIHDCTSESNRQTSRENFDNTINNHGKCLIEFCKNHDFRILNGRTKGDSFGKPTFHKNNGFSTIDYAVCNTNLLENINYFTVNLQIISPITAKL